MNIEPFIAFRYLRYKHQLNFITIISYLSIGGITLGVAALIIVLAVFNGFSALVTSFFMNFDPHIRVEAINKDGLHSVFKLETLIKREIQPASITPFVSGKVVVMKDKLMRVVTLKGIDPASGSNVYGIHQAMLFGKYYLNSEDETPSAIIGIYLADRLQALVGDTITVVSPSGIQKSIIAGSLPNSQSFIVAGIFNSRNNEYDANLLFTDVSTGQSLLGYDDLFQGYEFRMPAIEQSGDTQQKLNSILDAKKYRTTTWYDSHKELFMMMQIERWVAYILLSLIILVATFNILASLSMSVVEKKRDLGVLISLGLTRDSIKKIFLLQGLYVGLIGTGLGFILGLFVYWLQITYVIYPLDPSQYKIAALPMELRWTDFLAVGIASMGLSLLASIIPANRASSLDPLDAIRWE